MLIPVFVSTPTARNDRQDTVHRTILGELGHHGMEARTLGTTDYSTSFPLREVFTLARHCSGGVILGFTQFESAGGVWKRGTHLESRIAKGKQVAFSTPWNHIEAGILFGLGVPLLIFRDGGVQGGVFDTGVTDLFVHSMPGAKMDSNERRGLRAVFQKWTAQVRRHYYAEPD
jgi:hypothetical protein